MTRLRNALKLLGVIGMGFVQVSVAVSMLAFVACFLLVGMVFTQVFVLAAVPGLFAAVCSGLASFIVRGDFSAGRTVWGKWRACLSRPGRWIDGKLEGDGMLPERSWLDDAIDGKPFPALARRSDQWLADITRGGQG